MPALAFPIDGADDSLVLGFVANNETNELLVCSSTANAAVGVPNGWTDHRLVNQRSKRAPALAQLGSLVMAFVADNPSNDLLVCTSDDGVRWSDHALVNQRSKSAPALAARAFSSEFHPRSWRLSPTIRPMTF